jgi:hypothetical protein
MFTRPFLILLLLTSSKLVFCFNFKNPPPFQRKFNETGFKYSGFINITELGLGIGKPPKSSSIVPMLELRTINGYQFNYNFSLGAGLGVMTFFDGILLPITLDARFASGEGKNTAVFGLSGGATINNMIYPIFIFQPSIGLRHYVSENTAMVISLGSKMLFQENDKYYRDLTGKDVAFLNIITLNFGFSF